MAAPEGLFPAPPAPRPRRGAACAALEQTLHAWALDNHLTGPAHAADRAILRIAARTVDAAEHAAAAEGASVWTVAMSVRVLAELVASHRPASATAGDPLDAALAAILARES